MPNLCCKTSEKTKEIISNEEITENLSFFFKAFGEPIRIKILLALLHNEICVHNLSILLEASQPRISNQLKYLKMNKLIKSRKEKNNVYYSLNDKHIEDIINIGLSHINHL